MQELLSAAAYGSASQIESSEGPTKIPFPSQKYLLSSLSLFLPLALNYLSVQVKRATS